MLVHCADDWRRCECCSWFFHFIFYIILFRFLFSFFFITSFTGAVVGSVLLKHERKKKKMRALCGRIYFAAIFHVLCWRGGTGPGWAGPPADKPDVFRTLYSPGLGSSLFSGKIDKEEEKFVLTWLLLTWQNWDVARHLDNKNGAGTKGRDQEKVLVWEHLIPSWGHWQSLFKICSGVEKVKVVLKKLSRIPPWLKILESVNTKNGHAAIKFIP